MSHLVQWKRSAQSVQPLTNSNLLSILLSPCPCLHCCGWWCVPLRMVEGTGWEDMSSAQHRGCTQGLRQISAGLPISLPGSQSWTPEALSLGPHLRRRHQTDCGNELHSFCQSGIIKPPSVCSLQTGMADQLWHKQAGLVRTRGQIPPLQSVSGGRGNSLGGWVCLFSGWSFKVLLQSQPGSPQIAKSLGGLFFHRGNIWLGSSTRHDPTALSTPRTLSL